MKLKYLICNLKAHKTYNEMITYKNVLNNINIQNINFILAPSLIYLPLFKDTNINLCSQNLSLYDNLSLTGDITIASLKSLNVTYALIGHYEQRKYYKETEANILTKIKLALENNLKVIYCIGESLEQALRHVDYQVLEHQIACILNNIPENDFKNIIIAYEPTYMIGNNDNYDFKKIETNINFIKNIINSYYQGIIKVIYGGNINISNIDEFNHIKNLDGYIISSCALDARNIAKLINKINPS